MFVICCCMLWFAYYGWFAADFVLMMVVVGYDCGALQFVCYFGLLCGFWFCLCGWLCLVWVCGLDLHILLLRVLVVGLVLGLSLVVFRT